MRIARKICILGAISLNKIFIKICSHPIISWFFLWPPLFLMKKFCDPHSFFMPPPYSEENDSPLLLLVYLGAVAYISVEVSLGSCWRRNILKVKGQALFTNCNFLWLCVICNHRMVTTRCAIKYLWQGWIKCFLHRSKVWKWKFPLHFLTQIDILTNNVQNIVTSHK